MTDPNNTCGIQMYIIQIFVYILYIYVYVCVCIIMVLDIILSKPTFVDHYIQMACRVHIT